MSSCDEVAPLWPKIDERWICSQTADAGAFDVCSDMVSEQCNAAQRYPKFEFGQRVGSVHRLFGCKRQQSKRCVHRRQLGHAIEPHLEAQHPFQ